VDSISEYQHKPCGRFGTNCRIPRYNYGGSAAKNAAEKVRATLLEVGAEMTGVDVGALDLEDNYLVDTSKRGRLASFAELAAACFNKGKPMIGLGWHKSPPTSWHEEEGHGEAYFTFVYGANATEVEVDTETGKVDVIDFVSVHDVGKAINRGMVVGQMCGGVAMGLGYGLLEEFEFEDALPKQLNFDEYLIPTSMDVRASKRSLWRTKIRRDHSGRSPWASQRMNLRLRQLSTRSRTHRKTDL